MTEIYVLTNNEKRGPYSLGQVCSMYNNGALTSNSFYWQEGQADWLPIHALFASQPEEREASSIPTIEKPKIVRQNQSFLKQSNKIKPFFSIVKLIAVLTILAFIGFCLIATYNRRALEKKENEDIQASSAQLQQDIVDMNETAIRAHKVRKGMSAQDVERALGQPDNIGAPPREYSAEVKQLWHYGDDIVLFGWDNTVFGMTDEINFDKSAEASAPSASTSSSTLLDTNKADYSDLSSSVYSIGMDKNDGFLSIPWGSPSETVKQALANKQYNLIGKDSDASLLSYEGSAFVNLYQTEQKNNVHSEGYEYQGNFANLRGVLYIYFFSDQMRCAVFCCITPDAPNLRSALTARFGDKAVNDAQEWDMPNGTHVRFYEGKIEFSPTNAN
jgi:hypothetical protein